jgi:FMN phosphatase YigB (HAD superfamily)
MNTNISTIIFDLSEVYLQWLKWTEYKLSEILWIDHTIINRSFFTEKLNFLFHWKISENDYLLDLIKTNNWNIDIWILKNVIRNNFIEIQETREIIELLRKKWYKLWLLSVHAKEWIEYCNIKYNYHYLFDYVIYSFDIWISKPDQESFYYIMNLVNEIPENILFIDDNIKNIEASVNLWINWILFKDSKQLKDELIKLKIL